MVEKAERMAQLKALPVEALHRLRTDYLSEIKSEEKSGTNHLARLSEAIGGAAVLSIMADDIIGPLPKTIPASEMRAARWGRNLAFFGAAVIGGIGTRVVIDMAGNLLNRKSTNPKEMLDAIEGELEERTKTHQSALSPSKQVDATSAKQVSLAESPSRGSPHDLSNIGR